MSLDVIKKVNDSSLGKKTQLRSSYGDLFAHGVFAGIGWAVGVTIGFVLISVVLVFVLRSLGGLPIVGKWIAAIVEATADQLAKRTPIILQQ